MGLSIVGHWKRDSPKSYCYIATYLNIAIYYYLVLSLSFCVFSVFGYLTAKHGQTKKIHSKVERTLFKNKVL